MDPETTAPRGKILVVEDEPLIAMLLEDMLAELGYEVETNASRLSAALEAAASQAWDCAILDVSLGDEETYPVADILRTRHIPVIFATGYGREGLKSAYRTTPVLQKPFRIDDLQSALKAALASGG